MATTPKTVKKLSKVGEGIAVFLTQEAHALQWKQGEYVAVEVDKDARDERIILRRIKV